MRNITFLAASILLTACVGMPEKVKPVENFELQNYLGKWHEIARLDHSFERGLQRVTAEYTLRDDGGVAVKNRGFSEKKGKWQEATGKAYFVDDSTQGHLKVSFFGPFYSSYVIFDLDKPKYQYAFVSGPNLSYLWLLSRRPDPDQKIIERFKQAAANRGFATEELIFVEHP